MKVVNWGVGVDDGTRKFARLIYTSGANKRTRYRRRRLLSDAETDDDCVHLIAEITTWMPEAEVVEKKP